jgi:sodium-independent sulfate anion transporter 11
MLLSTGEIAEGLPDFQPPPFEFFDKHENRTVTFGEMTSNLGPGLIIVPLVALLEDIAICKAFCK